MPLPGLGMVRRIACDHDAPETHVSDLRESRASPEPTHTGFRLRASRIGFLARSAIVVIVYVVTAKVGLSLSVAHGSATPVWPPTGIALAALLLFGPEMSLAVFVGALIANLATPVPSGVAVAIAVGNTGEAFVGWFLLQRFGFRTELERVRDVIALVVVAAVVSTLVSATIGVTASLVAGTIAASDFAQTWSIWWVGDVMGDLLVASLLLVWIPPWTDWRRDRAPEAIALLILLVAVSSFVFAGDRWIYSFLVFPLLLWATLRFRQHGATLAIAVAAAIAVWQILQGPVPAGVSDITHTVEAFQALFGVVGVSLLIVAATTSERALAEATLADGARLQEQMGRALEREREASEELRSLDELKTTFLHAVSHDLRTPLASILGLAMTLQRHDLSLPVEERLDLADRIAKNARKLDRLVNDLLDFERIESGAVAITRQPTDVGSLVRIVVKELDLSAHPLHIETDDVVANIDAVQVERIVENLVMNAVHHTPAGTDVWLSVRALEDGILLSVEDSGPGVPEEERHHIFRPFRRSTERGSPGVGIGLSLVFGFAVLQGGRAWVDERAGGGAAFKVFLPNVA
jgi:signal transduction histidine kinase